MAKITNSLKKKLLENKISKLLYNIHVDEAEKEIYENKLNKIADKKVKQFKSTFRQKLLDLEIESLSNDAYLEYMTKGKLEKLETTYELKRKVVLASKARKLKKTLDQGEAIEADAKIKIDLIDQELTTKKEEVTKMYASRNYSEEQIKSNLKDFHDFEDKYHKTLTIFQSELDTNHKLALSNKTEKLNKKIEANEGKLKAVRALLKPVVDEMNVSLKSSYEIADDTILKLDGLTMQFGGLKAVDNLSFEVKKGEIFGLIGPNGAGKTTVFNCITQFYKPTEGKVIFRNAENDLVSLTDYKVHDVIKQGIVRTFQNVELIWELSIMDNMLVGAHSLYRSSFLDHSLQLMRFKREEAILKLRAEKILKDLGLFEYKDFYPIGLPYGVLKKIELARTLMTNPKLIILDEPAAGLNDSETLQLAETIQKIQKDYDCTIFLVEHDMGLVMNICHTICAISFGKKLAIGSPREVQQNDFVKEAYLGGE